MLSIPSLLEGANTHSSSSHRAGCLLLGVCEAEESKSNVVVWGFQQFLRKPELPSSEDGSFLPFVSYLVPGVRTYCSLYPYVSCDLPECLQSKHCLHGNIR